MAVILISNGNNYDILWDHRRMGNLVYNLGKVLLLVAIRMNLCSASLTLGIKLNKITD